MIRLIVLVALFAGAIELTRRAAEALNIVIEPTSFWIGLGVAVVAGAVDFWITNWWSTVTAPSRPQSVNHNTAQTPSQITWASFWAIIRGVMVFAIVGVIIYLSLFAR